MVNDEDLADTLFADSPEYTGTADLDFKIIEPSGIDIPTRIYSSPEEAVHTCAEMLGRRGGANFLLKCHGLCPICLTFLVVHFYTHIYVSILNLCINCSLKNSFK